MKRTGWLLLLGLAASSCNQKNAGQETSTVDTVAARAQAAPQKRVEPAAVGIIQRTTLIEPEYKDTVCWENCPGYYPLGSQDLLEAMSVRSLTQGEWPAKMFLKHRLDVSTAFHTVVVAYQPSENEIRNYLVTYSRNAERIDTCLVAADEIAEGLLSAYSVIHGNEIERHEFNYTNEEAPETVKRFVITGKGEIVEK
jgi:hypothetical protein